MNLRPQRPDALEAPKSESDTLHCSKYNASIEIYKCTFHTTEVSSMHPPIALVLPGIRGSGLTSKDSLDESKHGRAPT
jgi:hypothetical protein